MKITETLDRKAGLERELAELLSRYEALGWEVGGEFDVHLSSSPNCCPVVEVRIGVVMPT